MRCPNCGERDTRVVDSRDIDDAAIRRRRECNMCATRFTTYERIESARLTVIKSDGRREEFDRDKLASGLAKALTRRPVPDDAAAKAAEEIEAALRARGVSEVPSGDDRARWPWTSCASSTRSPTSDSPASTRASRASSSCAQEVDSLLAERERGRARSQVQDPRRRGGSPGKRYPKRYGTLPPSRDNRD